MYIYMCVCMFVCVCVYGGGGGIVIRRLRENLCGVGEICFTA